MLSELMASGKGLIPSPAQFNDCSVCHGGIINFYHDDALLDDRQFRVSCEHCGYYVYGSTWREALQRWNSGWVPADESTIDV